MAPPSDFKHGGEIYKNKAGRLGEIWRYLQVWWNSDGFQWPSSVLFFRLYETYPGWSMHLQCCQKRPCAKSGLGYVLSTSFTTFWNILRTPCSNVPEHYILNEYELWWIFIGYSEYVYCWIEICMIGWYRMPLRQPLPETQAGMQLLELPDDDARRATKDQSRSCRNTERPPTMWHWKLGYARITRSPKDCKLKHQEEWLISLDNDPTELLANLHAQSGVRRLGRFVFVAPPNLQCPYAEATLSSHTRIDNFSVFVSLIFHWCICHHGSSWQSGFYAAALTQFWLEHGPVWDTKRSLSAVQLSAGGRSRPGWAWKQYETIKWLIVTMGFEMLWMCFEAFRSPVKQVKVCWRPHCNCFMLKHVNLFPLFNIKPVKGVFLRIHHVLYVSSCSTNSFRQTAGQLKLVCLPEAQNIRR